MYCLYCGSTLRQDAQFCEACGKRQNVPAASTSPATSKPQPATNKGMVSLLLLFIVPLLFTVFHVVPAVMFVSVIFFWLFVFRHAGVTRNNALIGTAIVAVTAVGIQAYETQYQQTSHQQPSTDQLQDDEFEHRVGVLVNAGLSRADAERSVRLTMQNEAEAQAAQEPSHLNPPKYRFYKSKTNHAASYIVSANTTNEQLKSLLWFFRKKVRARAFAEIGITKPTSQNWGELNYSSGMLLIYRGEKCANEEYISTAQMEKGNLGPCGYGEHDDAYYQWGVPNPTKDRNGFFDGGAIKKNGDAFLIFQDKGKL